MIVIDGSQGEGGGQILRTALALSLVTKTPFRIERVRAGRARPGLMRQHLTAVNAAAQVGRAEVRGAEVGSQTLDFAPGPPTAGRYEFSVGTAGSATLVLQTVLPALFAAGGPSTVKIEGGTHNPMAPTFDFLDRAFLPLLARIGLVATAELERPGFYPAGGGRFEVKIDAPTALAPLELLERGPISSQRAEILFAALPFEIARRELSVLGRKLGWPADRLKIREVKNSAGPGNVVSIEIASAEVTEVVTSFGERRVRAEAVAEQAAVEALRYLELGAPVGEHLADQLLLPLALGAGGRFRTGLPSSHTRTQVELLGRFLSDVVECAQHEAEVWQIEVHGTRLLPETSAPVTS